MMLLLAFLLVSLLVLVHIARDDRPKAAPRSHFVEAASAHERWERV